MLKVISKKQFVVLIVLAMEFAFIIAPVHGATMQLTEVQLTSTPETQENPDIDGIHVVWQDNRSGNWDIYMYTLEHTFTPETQITNNPASQVNPAISGDKIVWQDDRNSNGDIYMYDITAKTETQITNNTANQENPDIDGNIIVWQDSRNGTVPQIYMYNLTSQTEKCISSSSPSDPTYQVMSNTNPAISGNRIVYQRREIHTFEGNIQEDHREIIVYDLTTETQTQIFQGYTEALEVVMNANDADCPAIYGSRIVFETSDPHWPAVDNFYREWNIRMHDIATSARWDTTINQANQRYPDINNNYIVYQDNRNGNWQIYLYNTDSGIESRITNNTATQQYPKVSDGRIVYMDNRNGNWDIYITVVGYVAEKISPPPLNHKSPLEGAPLQGFPIQENPETSLFTTAIIASTLVVATVLVSLAVIFFLKKRRQQKT
jgi:beta propeller repeat protein